MTEAVRANVYTLPFGADICDATIDLVLKSCGDKPLALTEAIIFLPNNRAIRAMTEGFVRRAQPGLLMPRLVAIGDLALDESLGPVLDPLESEASIPSLIAPLKRQLLLAEMVKQQREMAGQRVDSTEAMRLARLLAGLIDELEIEQVSLSDFQGIASEDEIVSDPDLAGHWQRSYASLLSIIPQYHSKLLELGCDGPAARRNLLLARFEQRLRSDPPTYPIFSCGISTAAPAIAGLLKTIAMLPTGHVVLPPIDLDMDEDAWQSLGPFEKEDGKLPELGKETHPQYHLKLLMERMSENWWKNPRDG
jgi:ATP-dependent helicase/nuclease subunit B